MMIISVSRDFVTDPVPQQQQAALRHSPPVMTSYNAPYLNVEFSDSLIRSKVLTKNILDDLQDHSWKTAKFYEWTSLATRSFRILSQTLFWEAMVSAVFTVWQVKGCKSSLPFLLRHDPSAKLRGRRVRR